MKKAPPHLSQRGLSLLSSALQCGCVPELWFFFPSRSSRKGSLLIIGVYVGWTPDPVIVIIGDNKDYIRVLFYSYHITITRWGVLLMYMLRRVQSSKLPRNLHC